MGRDVLSLRQMMVLLFTALLAPAADLLPTLAAQRAGSAGWLAPLGALPLLLLALWAGSGWHRAGSLGRGAEVGICLSYLAWTLLTLALSLRLCAARLAQIYGEGPAFFCCALLLALAVWMGWGKTAAFARAGEIFYLALAVALAALLLLAAFKIEGESLLLSGAEAAAAPGAGLAAAGLLLNLYPAAALGARVKGGPSARGRAVWWTVAFCVAAAALVCAVIGCMGPRLAGRLPTPFLLMAQGLGIRGAFQRLESLAAALWTLSDLTGIGLLLHAWRELAGRLHRGSWARWSVFPAAAAALAGGWLLFPTGERARQFCLAVLPALGLIMGLALPLLLRLWSGRRGKGR